MKIVNILGGLGNQMFQYALYLVLQNKFPDETIKLDCSYMSSYSLHNGLELEHVFGIKINQASFRELCKLTYPTYNYKLHRAIRKFIPLRKTEVLDEWKDIDKLFKIGSYYYDGYWQNYRIFDPYIRDKVKKAFQIEIPIGQENDSLLPVIKDSQSVSIHVRRGDYLKDPLYLGLCDIDYYKKTIQYIKGRVAHPYFVIFSNDINWCKSNIIPLIGDNQFVIVDWNVGLNSSLDLYMMSQCHHNIIANSSFSWWGAYLNEYKDKIVCSPKKWANTNTPQFRQMEDWILF